MAGSACGTFVAGGGVSGGLHLWCISTGRLYRSWPAHYKAVTCLAWTADASLLLSAGADGLVHAWLPAEILDEESGSNLEPWRTWPAHTLPVTGLALSPSGTRALSAGADGTLCVLGLGETVSPPSAVQPLARHTLPAALRSVVLDAAGGTGFAGAADGVIYEVVLSQESVTGERSYGKLEGHAGPVTCLAIAGHDGATLVSGSEDGTVRIWDLRTQQQIRVFDKPVGGGPVTGLLIVPRPSDLRGHSQSRQTGASTSSSSTARATQPAVLSKFVGLRNGVKPWEDVVVCLKDERQGMSRTCEMERMWGEAARCAGPAGPTLAVAEGPDFMSLEDDAAPMAQQQDDGGRGNAEQAAALEESQARVLALEEANGKLKAQLERAGAALQKLMEAQKSRK